MAESESLDRRREEGRIEKSRPKGVFDVITRKNIHRQTHGWTLQSLPFAIIFFLFLRKTLRIIFIRHLKLLLFSVSLPGFFVLWKALTGLHRLLLHLRLLFHSRLLRALCRFRFVCCYCRVWENGARGMRGRGSSLICRSSELCFFSRYFFLSSFSSSFHSLRLNFFFFFFDLLVFYLSRERVSEKERCKPSDIEKWGSWSWVEGTILRYQ